MTRKDYKLMAEELHDQWVDIPETADDMRHGFKLAVWSLNRALRADNYRFDEAKFMNAIFDPPKKGKK